MDYQNVLTKISKYLNSNGVSCKIKKLRSRKNEDFAVPDTEDKLDFLQAKLKYIAKNGFKCSKSGKPTIFIDVWDHYFNSKIIVYNATCSCGQQHQRLYTGNELYTGRPSIIGEFIGALPPKVACFNNRRLLTADC